MRGKYLVINDDDDVYKMMNLRLKYTVDLFESHPDIDVIGSPYIPVNIVGMLTYIQRNYVKNF